MALLWASMLDEVAERLTKGILAPRTTSLPVENKGSPGPPIVLDGAERPLPATSTIESSVCLQDDGMHRLNARCDRGVLGSSEGFFSAKGGACDLGFLPVG